MSAEKATAGTSSSDGTLRVAALGDLHVREDQPGVYRDLFAEISKQADVLVLTGSPANVLLEQSRGRTAR